MPTSLRRTKLALRGTSIFGRDLRRPPQNQTHTCLSGSESNFKTEIHPGTAVFTGCAFSLLLRLNLPWKAGCIPGTCGPVLTGTDAAHFGLLAVSSNQNGCTMFPSKTSSNHYRLMRSEKSQPQAATVLISSSGVTNFW